MGQKARAKKSSTYNVTLEVDMSVYDQLEDLNNMSGENQGAASQNEEADRDHDRSGPLWRRLYIRQQDLLRFGYTEGCNACDSIQRGECRTGILHSEECREHIMKGLERTIDGKERLAELQKREMEYLENMAAQSQPQSLTASAKRPRLAIR